MLGISPTSFIGLIKGHLPMRRRAERRVIR
jgi:hypothetical protein